jgi:hypothetical protein
MKTLRTVLGILLAVLAGLAAPLSVVAARAQTLVADTDAFVATYTPLVRDESVHQLVTAQLSTAITEQLGLADNRLAGRLVTRAVGEFVAGDTFDAAATASLRIAHAEFVALLTGEPGRLQVSEGEVQLRFAPFVEAVTQRLTDAGVPFLDRLPEVTGGITLFRIDPQVLPLLQAGFRTLTAVAAWLPWVAVALAIAALWVWPGARRPLIGLGASLLGWSLVVWVAGWGLLQGLRHRVADDLALVAGLLVRQTAAPALSPLLAIAVTGLVLTTLALLAAKEPQH